MLLSFVIDLNYSHQGYEDAAYRTPMLWNDDSIKSASYIYQGTNNAIRNAITTSTITVEDSMQNSDSLLHHYQKIIELKKNNETISKGSLERVHLDDRLITYQITDDDKTLLVIHNITNQAIFSSLNKAFSLLDYVSLTTPFVSVDQMLNIPAMSSVILELEEPLELPNTPLIEDVYIRGSLTNWSLSSIYKMLYENDQYTYELNIDEVTEFKLFKSDVWYGYDALVMPDSSYLTKEVLNGNIVIQPGNYLLIFKNGNITITQK